MTISKSRIKKLEEAIRLNNRLDNKNNEDTKLHHLTFITEKGERRVETYTLKEVGDIINKVYGTDGVK